MSGVVDVGEAFELTFSGAPGSLVTASWLDPDLVAVEDGVVVAETTAGKYPKAFIPTRAGMWTALFLAPGQPERYYVRATALTGPLPFAAIGDVGAQFGALTPAQEGLTGHLVRAGSSLLRQRVPRIDADVAAGRVDADVAALTVANMVLRVLRNPQGLRAETTGPFSRTYDTSAAAGLLVLTPDDLAAVTPEDVVPAGTAGIGVGTIRVVGGMIPPVRHLPWSGDAGRW